MDLQVHLLHHGKRKAQHAVKEVRVITKDYILHDSNIENKILETMQCLLGAQI